MQRTGGGAPRPGRNHGLPGSLRQPDPAALLMLLVNADRPEPVRSGARELALFLTPEPGAEAKEVEETIEGMLLRLEEFCSLADLIRSDTSQILEENIPVLKAKLTEMRGIYAKVDRLEKSPAPVPVTYELPTLYRTEDYFPADAREAQHHPRTCPRPL
ncbi:breast carcinoma-amplified sequence 4 isoform X3 [Chlorocebus sabaeus]|uniref:breast carcinoma-amplified sequence 4 isoform X3 n=1 Tax=Chlorocebus sabaeus TaxID=60711 RepID=UPI00045E2D65|nr:breast carcinoma-amplified sequence 4 isoform X3 [Chlorocebus sabaeus]XP_025255496.1 breast carcinoma-amplified sequence 4 isoform X2 [Theropithecus gelada]